MVVPIVVGALGTVTKGLVKGLEGNGNKMTVEDNPNCNIVEPGQNTEKSPRDLKRLVVTQTSVKDHRLTLM